MRLMVVLLAAVYLVGRAAQVTAAKQEVVERGREYMARIAKLPFSV